MTKDENSESRSGEEIKMKKKEQLQEETPEAPKEEAKKEKVTEEPKTEAETTKEEPVKEEAPVEKKEEEKPAEEKKPAEDEKKEDVKETEEVPKEEPKEGSTEEKTEDLTEDIKQTKEELQVVREVRDELVALYAKNKDIESVKEQLSKENEQLKESNGKLKEQLQRYLDAEETLQAKEHNDRVEKLSAKFKLLGQEKTAEQLAKKDAETLAEFETIVDAALEKAGETKERLQVTEPSQGAEESEDKKETEGEKTEEKPKEEEQLNNDAFFRGICQTLTNEQTLLMKGSRARYL